MAIAMGMATGSISLTSKCIGEGNFSRFSRYAGQLIVLNFVLSLFVAICAFFFIEHLLDLLGVKDELKRTFKSLFLCDNFWNTYYVFEHFNYIYFKCSRRNYPFNDNSFICQYC